VRGKRRDFLPLHRSRSFALAAASPKGRWCGAAQATAAAAADKPAADGKPAAAAAAAAAQSETQLLRAHRQRRLRRALLRAAPARPCAVAGCISFTAACCRRAVALPPAAAGGHCTLIALLIFELIVRPQLSLDLLELLEKGSVAFDKDACCHSCNTAAQYLRNFLAHVLLVVLLLRLLLRLLLLLPVGAQHLLAEPASCAPLPAQHSAAREKEPNNRPGRCRCRCEIGKYFSQW
jgi:hypothetical protein